MKDTIKNIHTNEFLENLLIGNRQMCSKIAKQYLSEDHSIKDLYEDVFKEALYEVGLLWENNKISVAVEHMATVLRKEF